MTTSSDPDEIRAEIERTRSRLSDDVDTLTDEANPKRIAQRQVGRTRDALTGVKDRVMGRAADAGDSVTGTASGVRDSVTGTASGVKDRVSGTGSAIQEKTEGNPLAAGLIAFGAGMLLSSLLPASEPEQQIATQVKDFAVEQGRPVAQELGQAGQEAAQELKESAQQRAESVKQTASDAASTVKEEAQSATSDVKGQAKESAGRVRDQAGPS